MGKVNELSQLIEELNRCGNTLIGISEELKNLFSGSEEAEPKTKTAKETPAKAPKKEKTLSCGHVHDELIIECSRDVSLDVICEQMGRTPPWIPGLLLRADGYECDFYKKD